MLQFSTTLLGYNSQRNVESYLRNVSSIFWSQLKGKLENITFCSNDTSQTFNAYFRILKLHGVTTFSRVGNLFLQKCLKREREQTNIFTPNHFPDRTASCLTNIMLIMVSGLLIFIIHYRWVLYNKYLW